MDSVSPAGVGAPQRRRRMVTAVKDLLRELSGQLSLLNHHVGAHLQLKGVDLDCLEVIARHGPLSPSALARHAGLHPATVTGILDRLERGGWVARDRDPADRRGILVRPLRDRNVDLFRLYSTMNTSLEEICSRYTDSELAVLTDFLRRATAAGHNAATDLAGS